MIDVALLFLLWVLIPLLIVGFLAFFLSLIGFKCLQSRRRDRLVPGTIRAGAMR